MKTNFKFLRISLLCLVTSLFSLNSSFAQLNGFLLKPSGDTEDYMKYIRNWVTYNGTNYYTGYLTLSAYKNITTGQLFNTVAPLQKLQLQGGNILLCRTNSAPGSPDLNPTSRNGAILFSDMVTTTNDWIHGKWGIEYDDQYSTGGLNFFNPKSSLTPSRLNFKLFIGNNGNVGIGTGVPATLLHVAGEATIASLTNDGTNFVTSDANGKLLLAPVKLLADNLGNHTATTDLNMNRYAVYTGRIFGYSIGDDWGKLEIFGSSNADAAKIEVGRGGDVNNQALKFSTSGQRGSGFQFLSYMGTSLVSKMTIISESGNSEVIIGTSQAGNETNLKVNGKIFANEVKVSLDRWYDVVFSKDYKLMPLAEVSTFIASNSHLPEIPSDKEVLANGLNMGEMNALLLKKIEELTLYLIDQQKQIDELKAAVTK